MTAKYLIEELKRFNELGEITIEGESDGETMNISQFDIRPQGNAAKIIFPNVSYHQEKIDDLEDNLACATRLCDEYDKLKKTVKKFMPFAATIHQHLGKTFATVYSEKDNIRDSQRLGNQDLRAFKSLLLHLKQLNL